jgi:hypothetical protein
LLAPRANVICEPLTGTLRRALSGRPLIVSKPRLRAVSRV